MIDPGTVPPTPLYVITLVAGGATINGEPVAVSSSDPQAARMAALAEIRVKAAYAGRPVRVLAKEMDGSAWPMIVDADGNVTTLNAPHPAPEPAPHRAFPTPAPHAPAPRAPHPAPTTLPPASLMPHTPASPAPVPTPHTANGSHGGPVNATPSHAAAPPVPPAAPQTAAEWTAPLPPAHEPALARVRAAEEGGDLPAAVVAAEELERALEAQYGPLHPYTVNVLTLRAMLTARQGVDWYETVELLITTAMRRADAGAQPESETTRAVHNAHGAWRMLAREDPEGAMELCEPLVKMLTHFGEEKRTQHVLNWVDKTRMGSQ